MGSEKDTLGWLNTLIEQLARLFCYLAPGIVVLELVFNKGVFSENPKTLYDFIIFLLWAALTSVPFNFSIPISVKTYLEKMITYAYDEMELQNVNPERLDKKATLGKVGVPLVIILLATDNKGSIF